MLMDVGASNVNPILVCLGEIWIGGRWCHTMRESRGG